MDVDSVSAKATALTKTKTKTRLEDVPQNHQLSQKRLLSREAQRISNILENCISRVEIAAALPAVLQLNSVSSVVDKELSRTLQEHQILEKRLETLEGLRQESDGEEDGEPREQRKKARAQLERDIKNSVRDLLRLVRARPDVTFGLTAELGMEVGEGEYMLIRGLEKFHSYMVERLLLSLDEELQQVLQKQVPSSLLHDQDLVSLEDELTTSMKKLDAEIPKKNLEVKNLQSFLQEKNTQEEAALLLAEQQYQSLIKTPKVKPTSMQQETELNVRFNNLILENRQAERALKEKIEKVETEIECLLQSFDDEIGENQADLELNEMDNESIEEELRKLEKPFFVLEMECNQIEERRRLAEEERKEKMRELELKTKAAIFAQAWWRGYSTRNALKNKGKSKKAKKGKGKKTK